MLGESKKSSGFKINFLTLLYFVFLFILVFLLYSPVFLIFFNADDFFVLQQVKNYDLKEIWQIFIPINSVVYYRPLGIQFFFWILYKFIALNYFYYHLLSFIIFLINGILVYFLAKKISKSQKIGLIASFLWLTSSVHFLSLGWIVNFSYIFGTFFYFLTIILWLDKKYYLTLLTFILGLLTNELIVTLPFLLIILRVVLKKKLKTNLAWKDFPFFCLLAVYLFLRFFVFKTAGGGIYQFDINLKTIINNYQWYLLWAFSWPETMKDQMVNIFIINQGSDFLKNFSKEFWIFVISFWIMSGILFYKTIINIFKGVDIKLYLLSLSFFLLGVIPVVFFPAHIYPHYASISLFGLVLAVGLTYQNLQKLPDKVSFFCIILLWLLISCTALNLNLKVSWLVWHSQLAEKIITESLNNYQPGTIKIKVKGDKKQNSLVLNNQDAFKLIFRNDRMETIYVDD